jgi:hypothetical protein
MIFVNEPRGTAGTMKPSIAIVALLMLSSCASIEYGKKGRTQLVEFVSEPPGATITLDERIYPEPIVTPATIRLSRWVPKMERWELKAHLPERESYQGDLPSKFDESIGPLRFLDLCLILPGIVDLVVFDVANHGQSLMDWPSSVRFHLAPSGERSKINLTWLRN